MSYKSTRDKHNKSVLSGDPPIAAVASNSVGELEI
jgi:hypothetical protein